jgi:hypothetical protein
MIRKNKIDKKKIEILNKQLNPKDILFLRLQKTPFHIVPKSP